MDIDPRLRELQAATVGTQDVNRVTTEQQARPGTSSIPQHELPYYADQQRRYAEQAQDAAVHYQMQAAHYPTHEHAPQKKDDYRRSRACEACRGLKVKCEPDPNGGACKRCTKANRNCVITAPNRKRQKKTDTRVAELERKIDALTATLQATKNGTADYEEYSDEEQDGTIQSQVPNGQSWQQSPLDATRSLKRRASTHNGDEAVHQAKYPRLDNFPFKPQTDYEYADVVDRGIVDAATADSIFEVYNTRMVPQMPVVVFPPGTTAGAIRKDKPILFLAILSVATFGGKQEVQRILREELSRVLADRIMCRGEKSVEIIQAIQVSTIWHCSKGDDDTLAYQNIHSAATMAIAIGLGRPGPNPASLSGTFKDVKLNLTDPRSIECRRAWLSCYLLCGKCVLYQACDQSYQLTPFIVVQ
jgi:hypothetical protein